MRLFLASMTAGVALLAFSQNASAVTISLVSDNASIVPSTNFITAPVSSSGVFALSTTGSDLGVKRSPYENTPIANTPYSIISSGSLGAGSATYDCPNCTTFSFLWGSPDDYNFVRFYSGLNGTGDLISTFIGTDVVPPGTVGLGFNEVGFAASGGTFSSVVFSDSGRAAFEYSNVRVNSVPGPIVGSGLSGLGLVVACGSLIGFARRRRRQLA